MTSNLCAPGGAVAGVDQSNDVRSASDHQTYTDCPDSQRWRGRAACRGCEPALFFPTGVSGEAFEQILVAQAVCSACEVKPDCLEYALSTNQESGIWGGATEQELVLLRRTRRRIKGPEVAARALRRRAETIRQEAISRHHVSSVDPALLGELSRCVMEALIGPVLTALDSAHGRHRQQGLAKALFDLFDL